MLHKTKYSDQVKPNEVNEFVLKNLKKHPVNLGKLPDNSIFFEIEGSVKTLGFVITDYYIECEAKSITTNALTKNWQKYMVHKFGKDYVNDYNRYNSNNMEL